MMHPTRLLALAAALPFAATAPAQSITAIVVGGDTVPGVGNITTIDNFAVNNAGSWLVESDTDHPDTTADSVLLRDGLLYLREGDPVPPPGASLGSFDAITLNSNGDSGFNFFLDGTGSSSTDSGVYFNTSLLIQEGDISAAPEFSPGTPYIGFFEVKINDAGRLLVVASVDDPAIPSSVDRALVFLDTDGTGVLLSETVIYKEGDILPGQTEALTDFGTGPHEFAFNAAGQVLFTADLAGSTASNTVIYIDGTKLAQKGEASPLPGRNWLALTSP